MLQCYWLFSCLILVCDLLGLLDFLCCICVWTEFVELLVFILFYCRPLTEEQLQERVQVARLRYAENMAQAASEQNANTREGTL